jgi:hypothetical protein
MVYMANVKYRVKLDNYADVTVLSDWFAYGTDIGDELYWSIMKNYERFVKPSTVQWDYSWGGKWDKEMTEVTESITYKAKLDSSLRKYAVKFVDEDGTVLKEAVEYEYGTLASAIELPDETPTKEPTVVETFAFAGWDVSDVTESITYVASFTPSPRMYTVSFVDEDDSPIASAEYAYGTAASAIVLPDAPFKANRRFVGWNPEVSDVAGAAEYVAQYVDDNKFVVTWRNDDGTVLYEKTYSSGETPVYGGETPVKESTDEYSYEFAGWTLSAESEAGDREYVAAYTGTKREYLVRFVNYDETLLLETMYEYGTVVADIEVPENPTKPSTETNVYTFVGWSPELSDVTGEVTYTARFAGRPITSSSSSAVVSSSSAESSSSQESSSSEASSSSEEESSSSEETAESSSSETVVSSSSEEPEISSSSAEESSSSVQMFTVTYECRLAPAINCWLRNIPYQITVAEGTPISSVIPAENPKISFDETEQYTYEFVEWSFTGETVNENIQLIAEFIRVVRQYTITFVDWDGSEIASDDYEYGTSATDITPSAPTRESDEQYSYTFAGWSPAVAIVTGEATYTATYTPTPLPASSSGEEESSSSETPVVSSSSEEPIESSSSETPVVSSSSETPVASSSSEKPASSSSTEIAANSSSSTSAPLSSSRDDDASSSSADKPKSSASEDDSSSSSDAKSSSSGKPDGLYPTVGSVNMVFAHNELTVTVSKASEVKVQVFDMQGNLQERYQGYSAGDHVVSLRHLNKGVYIVQVASGSAVKNMRVMVR